MRDKKINFYWSWTDFSVGFSIAKPHRASGYNLYISLDLGFFSVWIYLLKLRKKLKACKKK